MKLLKYSNTKEKTASGNSDLYIDSFQKKIIGRLKNIEATSEIQGNTVLFKRIVRNTTHSGKNKMEALKILREGIIKIEKIDSKHLKIYWEVNLDTIIFLSFLIGLFIGLMVQFAGSIILISLISGLLFFIISYFIGCSIIKAKIDRIVEESI